MEQSENEKHGNMDHKAQEQDSREPNGDDFVIISTFQPQLLQPTGKSSGILVGQSGLGALSGSSESTCRKVVVGIFSRSSGTDYNWLTTHLKSEAFQNLVEDVKPFFISNSNGKEFRNRVAECNFCILYHTKKRGRVNVTDVTDSLYDYELNYMSDILGKRNVIVVVDDLQESSAAEKNRILKSQTSITELAADIILFTDKERDPNYREPLPTPEDKEGLQKKLLILKELLEKAKDAKDVEENERTGTDSTDQQKRTEQSDQAKSEQERTVTDITDEQKGAGECDNDLKTTNV
ncbi:uncharacterized protein LOC128641822 isoform X2 [Bombina bombina]|uniref:uncharacterized protein LOC128641822 isoform X2 n=1 Tax=Bombina bombina TaxID=8345 RepID=UPI00235A9BB6|nr:uncharacterized protein LOC128641822 isoform X2 [Bombina bombina]